MANVTPGHGVMLDPGRNIVRIDRRHFRPAVVDTPRGNATKPRTRLGWTPEVRFQQLVAEMVREDLRIVGRDELVQRHGHAIHKRNIGWRGSITVSRCSMRA